MLWHVYSSLWDRVVGSLHGGRSFEQADIEAARAGQLKGRGSKLGLPGEEEDEAACFACG